MKVMSRNFTTTEKVLIIFLALVLVGLVYYQFVDKMVRSSIEASNAEYAELRTEFDELQTRLQHLKTVQNSLEEMKADVESAKKLGPSGQMDIVALAELEQNSEAAGGGGGGCGRAKSRPGSPALTTGAPQAPGAGPLQLSPASPLTDQPASSQDCSEDEEDEEIDVDD